MANMVPLEVIASCARGTLVAVRAACDDGNGGCVAARIGTVRRLVEAEVLPQAGRWHRRDLAPALSAAWRAVLRALPPGAGSAPPPAQSGCSSDPRPAGCRSRDHDQLAM